MMDRFAKRRQKRAAEEGRMPGRDGHPPYLETDEVEELETSLILKTLENKIITISDIAGFVLICLFSNYFFVSGIFNKTKKN
jgi:hypothetical protein